MIKKGKETGGKKVEEKDRKAKRSELLRELIGMYQPESAGEVSTMLRDLFAGTMEDM